MQPHPITQVSEILTVIDPDSEEAQSAEVEASAPSGAHGSFIFNDATGAWINTPDSISTDDIARAKDQSVREASIVTLATESICQTIMVSLGVANDEPDATDDSGHAFTTGSVRGNASGLDASDIFSVTALSAGASLGRVTDNGDGVFAYVNKSCFYHLLIRETAVEASS